MADLETIDIYGIDDFLPHMPEARGRVALMHRLGRRLITPRGRFKPWPNFGTDMRRYLLSKVPSSQIAQDAKDEVEKDEEVESASVTVQHVDFDQRELELNIEIVDTVGVVLTFTLSITDARVTLIGLQQQAL